MSYHVTILRTRQGKPQPIGRDEVLAVVGARPELQVEAGKDGTLQITVRERGEERPLLIWEGGELWARDPDPDTLGLLVELAEPLGARVRGDELETYRSATETYTHPDDAAAIRLSEADVRRLKARSRVLSYLPPLLFFALALLYGYCARSGRR